MTGFNYEARDATGNLVNGTIQAINSNQAADFLFKQNLTPIKITASKKKETGPKKEKTKKKFDWHAPIYFRKKVKNEELLIFCRQMHSLVKAGVPIATAIQRISEITRNPAMKEALNQLTIDIGLGNSLSESMRRHPIVFSTLMTSLIASAEASGRLEDAFSQAAYHYELESTSRKRVKAALRYPFFVIAFALLAVMVISVFVIPRFAAMYTSFHATLPLATRIILKTSLGIQYYWWAIILGLLLIGYLIKYFLQNPRFRFFIDRNKLRVPVFGKIIDKILMANFSRNLAMLIESGVPLLNALVLVSDVVNNVYARKKILELRDEIERGKNLSTAAANLHFFSPLVLQMLSVGDETGNTDAMLDEVSKYYEEEVDFELKRLTARIEPILLIVVGGIVLLIGIGVFLPMWNMVYVVK